jgi:hypothetical protein
MRYDLVQKKPSPSGGRRVVSSSVSKCAVYSGDERLQMRAASPNNPFREKGLTKKTEKYEKVYLWYKEILLLVKMKEKKIWSGYRYVSSESSTKSPPLTQP